MNLETAERDKILSRIFRRALNSIAMMIVARAADKCVVFRHANIET